MICLDGISSTELPSVLDYIYLGEVKIFQENLDRFLKVGEKLELEGLLTSDEFEPKTDEKPYDTKTLDDYKIAETESFSTKQSRIVMNANGLSTIEELDSQILQHIVRTPDGNNCGICNYTSKKVSHLKEHIESHFKGLSFACKFCGKNFSSRAVLRKHKNCKW